MSLFYNNLYSKREKIAYSSILAFVLLFLSYLLSNWEYAITGESNVLKLIGLIKNYNRDYNDPALLNRFTFINVSHDKFLVDIDDTGLRNDAITDRYKLFKFLKHIEHSDYDYVILDIDFIDDYFKTHQDSIISDSLYNIIERMPNLIIAADYEYNNLLDKRILKKAHWVHYGTNIINSDFVKYPLLRNDTSSIPLKVYEDLNDKCLKQFLFLYFDRFSLSRKVIYPAFYIKDNNDTIEINKKEDLINTSNPLQKSFFYELGADMIKYFEDDFYDKKEVINRTINKKIIIVGNYDGKQDNHNSYVGEMHGPLIIANCIISLEEGVHNVSFWAILILFTFFFLSSYHIIYNEAQTLTLTNLFFFKNSIIGTRMLPFVLLWTYYSLMLSIICILIYLLLSEVYDILFTSTILTMIDFIIKFFNYKFKK